MNTHETPHNRQHRRLTIGYFSRPLHSDTAMRIWRGVVAGARAHDVNLICMIGGEAYTPTRRLVYDLATLQRLDGIVTWASSEDTELGGLYERFRDVPLVSITLPLPGRPVVTADGYPGMYDAVSHLIEVHHRRKFVFIAGPAGHRPADFDSVAIAGSGAGAEQAHALSGQLA
jgi:DNA-binding LacI/PurR family transcriptional regulator